MAKHPLTWKYWSYGCQIESEVPIPILLPLIEVAKAKSHASASVLVTLVPPGKIYHTLPAAVTQQKFAAHLQAKTTTLYLKNIGTFFIEQGRNITCDLNPQATEATISVALSGTVMAALLCQRRYFIAHGSAVTWKREGAAIFLGDSGAGKSSFAMAMHQAGHPILTDDLIAIQTIDGKPYIFPAFPQSRVTRETATALGLDWSQLIELSTPEKRGYRFTSNFTPRAVPLQQIYILKQSEAIAIRSLAPHEKIMELMHHSEAMALLKPDKSDHFQACADLANQLPIHYLERPKNWSKLPEVIHHCQNHWKADAHFSTSGH